MDKPFVTPLTPYAEVVELAIFGGNGFLQIDTPQIGATVFVVVCKGSLPEIDSVSKIPTDKLMSRREFRQ